MTRSVFYKILTFATLFTHYLQNVQGTLLKSYGDPCDNFKTRCDTSRFLTCVNSSCQCVDLDMMTFDDKIEACVCLLDYFLENGTCEEQRELEEPCKETSQCLQKSQDFFENTLFVCVDNKCSCDQSVSVPSTNFDLNPEKNYSSCLRLLGETCRWSRNSFQNCIPGAMCKLPETRSQIFSIFHKGVCTCDEDPFQSKNKNCILKKSHGQNCLSSVECKGGRGLSCISGKCQCPSQSVLHPISKVCVGKVNEECNKFGCVPNAVCYNSKCYCERTPVASQDGFCYIREGGTCDSDPLGGKQCVKGLLCRNKRCSCPFKDHQNTNDRSCETLVNGPCNDSQSCVNNANCVNKGGLQICQCKPGFIEVDRECNLSFGERCSQEEYSIPCDRAAQLECTGGTCQCSDFQFYDLERHQCRGLIGAKCTSDSCVDMVLHVNPSGEGVTPNLEFASVCLASLLIHPIEHAWLKKRLHL